MILYHGGAPGFKVGDVIEPHETKHLDGCEWCASGNDDSHLPDRVFASPVRVYAKHYASKFIRGSVYIVTPIGTVVRSDADSIETYHALSLKVIKVTETMVVLTDSERRHVFRLWEAADRAAGREVSPLIQMQLHQQFGIRA